ncbi:hypothetical protein [Flavobacterium aquidurense]|uniref:Uncharacterized protein n=1 Tax=Flavobacterium aquidurense TaxID=362413 RepID=A0A0Q0WTP8_9FLAO|nr:hypothetical protein [Flavobacterium aquidurense]KQB39408.1 hypothetical protein RC62_1089 [Flavobacterium aquidurense]
MEKNTRENVENDYKEAIRAKYRKEKEGGEYYDFLAVPGQASLRDLCWKIFRSNPKYDDLKVYLDFFKFEFDPKEENTSTTYTDKFRKVGTFYKVGKKPAKNSTIELAAILVDFEPRPFNKFRIHNLYPDEIQNEDGNNSEISNQQKGQSESSGDLEVFLDGKEREKGIIKAVVKETDNENIKEGEEEDEKVKERESEEEREEEGEEIRESTFEEVKLKSKAINAFVTIQENPRIKLGPRIKNTIIGLTIVLCIGFAVIFFAFPAKGCMQWSGDHYDIVDCGLKAPDNNIVLLDPNQINLKRIKVCDTTHFFKNGKPVVFYARSGDSLECFNQIGPHPERPTQYLKPITQYMIGEYISNKPCK